MQKVGDAGASRRSAGVARKSAAAAECGGGGGRDAAVAEARDPSKGCGGGGRGARSFEGMRRWWPRREILRRDAAAAPRPVARCRRDAGAERVGYGPRVNGNN
jgi:hypothetical protein